jgi:ADP-heptose:LPS heptosyltransferase
MKRFFIYAKGGLGDIIRRYCQGQDGWAYLPALKKKFPDARIRLVVLSHNLQAAEFFKHHPMIDEIVTGPWENPNLKKTNAAHYATGYQKLIGSTYLKVLTPSKHMRVYLDQQDENFVKSIASQGNFIVIHPFASQSRKIVWPIKEYFPLVDQLIDELKFNVIIIGANWTCNRGKPTNIIEQFPYNREGLFNLIDKTNSRTAIRLVQKAKKLISVRSFCFSSTITGNIKATLLVGGGAYLNRPATIRNLKAWGWGSLNQIKVVDITGKQNPDVVRNNIIKFYSEG